MEESHPHGTERYKLSVRLDITKETWQGQGSNGYWQSGMGNERLGISEDLNLGALDFMGLMRVLGELHEAVTGMKAKKDNA